MINLELMSLVGVILLPKVGILDLSIISLLPVLLLYCTLPHIRSRFVFSKNVQLFICLNLCCAIISIASVFLNGGMTLESQFILKPFRIIVLACLAGLIFHQRSMEACIIMVIRAIFWASLINAGVMYLQYVVDLNGGPRDLLVNLNANERVVSRIRKPGLMSGFPVAGMLSVFGAYAGVFLYTISKSLVARFYLLASLAISLTTLFSSRMALMIGILTLPLMGFWLAIHKKKVSLIIVIGILVAGAWHIVPLIENPTLVDTRNKMFYHLDRLYQGDDVNDQSSLNLIEDHYVLPTDNWTLMWGDSLPPDQSAVESDVSLVRITWNSGIVVAFINLFLYLVASRAILIGGRISSTRLFILPFLVAITIANFKGSYIFSRVLGDAMLLLFMASNMPRYGTPYS